MNLLLALDHRFERTPDGTVWSWFFDRAFWARYLEVFDHIQVLARLRDVEHPSQNVSRSDSAQISFQPVPFYHGPMQYLLRRRSVHKVIHEAADSSRAVILRSGQIGNALASILHRKGHPYGLEVIGDPYDVFAPGANTHPLRPFLRWWYPRQVRRLCRRAAGVAYVTASALQKRYPPGGGTYSTSYSSIDLDDSGFVSTPRVISKPAQTLLTVGTMDQPYKGHDVLLRALAEPECRAQHFQLTIAGDGRFRPSLEALADRLKIREQVSFLGQLPRGQAVFDWMDRSDIFVLPSRTEGLPRALMEAMARGMPCVASTIGGTPELLVEEDRFPPGDFASLARKLCEVSSNRVRMSTMSARNLAKAQEYHRDILGARRREFYRIIKSMTETQWRSPRTQG